MGRIVTVVVLGVILLSLPSVGTAATYYVPSKKFSTIQSALDVANGGSTVVVRDGVYTGTGNKNLDFKGKAITLRSENGPARCIIDCEAEGSGVNFSPNVSRSDQILQGISIINAWESAIYCDSAHVQIRNCIISGSAAYQGGGISCFSSSAVIENCTISGNAAFFHGGGIYCFESTLKVRNSHISGNDAQVGGGGMLCYNSSVEVGNCVISGNQGYDYGGGFSSNYSSVTLTNCTIADNSSYGVGGGLDIFNSPSFSLTNCLITANHAEEGGGVYLLSSSLIVRNCTFSDSTAAWYGGGGGGIYADSSQGDLTNSILWNDSVGVGCGPEISLANESSFTVSHCDVEGGEAAVCVDPGCTLTWGVGNISEDPLFVTGPGGDYYLSQTTSGQTADSPCTNSGNGLVAATIRGQYQTTRTDQKRDHGITDMGYHARNHGSLHGLAYIA